MEGRVLLLGAKVRARSLGVRERCPSFQRHDCKHGSTHRTQTVCSLCCSQRSVYSRRTSAHGLHMVPMCTHVQHGAHVQWAMRVGGVEDNMAARRAAVCLYDVCGGFSYSLTITGMTMGRLRVRANKRKLDTASAKKATSTKSPPTKSSMPSCRRSWGHGSSSDVSASRRTRQQRCSNARAVLGRLSSCGRLMPRCPRTRAVDRRGWGVCSGRSIARYATAAPCPRWSGRFPSIPSEPSARQSCKEG